jgi:hypothetical protein
MLKVNYCFKKGLLFINLEGILNIKSTLELSNSISFMIEWIGFNNIVLDIKKAIVSDKYLFFLLDNIFDTITN